MTWHRVWMIRCNSEGCSQAAVTVDPAETPQGWATDGSQHMCDDCVSKSQPQPQTLEDSPAIDAEEVNA